MTIKCAVIGLGVMGSLHARVYSELGVLDGVSDLEDERTCSIAGKHHVRPYTGLKELVLRGVNAATVAVPTEHHVEIVEEVLDLGLDVLVEKPIALSVQDAIYLADKATRLGRILSVGYIERYNPAFTEVERIISTGELGEIIAVNIKRVGGIPRSANNVILDLMTHDIDMLLSLLHEEPDAIYVKKQVGKNNVVDAAHSMFEFGNTSAVCEANWVSPVKIRYLHITGRSGYCEADLIQQQVRRFYANTDSSPVKTTVKYNAEPLKRELQAFIHAVKTRNTLGIVTAESAIQTLKVTLQTASTP